MSAYDTELFANSWMRCWDGVTGHKNDLLRDVLIWMYSSPKRYYHNVSHLIGCIQIFKENRELADNPNLVELALWFHDAIYDINSKTNETMSYEFLFNELNLLNNRGQLDRDRFVDLCRYLPHLITATTHDLAEDEGYTDQKLICDIDLVTLGSDKYTFNNYCVKIRKEYIDIDSNIYYNERIKVLQYFLNRGFVYRLPKFKDKYERVAQENLTVEIGRIKNLID